MRFAAKNVLSGPCEVSLVADDLSLWADQSTQAASKTETALFDNYHVTGIKIEGTKTRSTPFGRIMWSLERW